MRIAVTGRSGQVDTSLQAVADAEGVELIRLGRPEIDLARPDSLAGPLRAARPDVIVSAAAFTAVDKAESEAELAQKVNGDGPGALATVAADLGVPILHLSTDYVFAGDKEGRYTENDPAAPGNAYGRSKLSGERQVAAAAHNHVILRTSWVYSPYGNNFVKTMLRLGETRDVIQVVADQRGCPTYAPDIAAALLRVARRVAVDDDPALRGIFHMAGPEDTNWAEFARAIFNGAETHGRRAVRVDPIPTSAYPTPARRPANSRLDSGRLAATYGVVLPSWRASLTRCLDTLLN